MLKLALQVLVRAGRGLLEQAHAALFYFVVRSLNTVPQVIVLLITFSRVHLWQTYIAKSISLLLSLLDRPDPYLDHLLFDLQRAAFLLEELAP